MAKSATSTTLYTCCKCGKEYKTQNNNFPKSQSEIFKGNNYFLPICKNCFNEIFNLYLNFFDGDLYKSIRQLCQLFDVYYDASLIESLNTLPKGRSKIMGYMAKQNLNQCQGKTYINTLKEEKANAKIIESYNEVEIDGGYKTKKETIKFFGTGFTDEDYIYLQDQYDDWTTRHECNTKAQEVLFKQICYTELDILQLKREGKSTEKSVKTLQDLMESSDLKPKQNKDNALTDQNTFGTLIQKWENEDPIPEPDEKWKDVDRIGQYVDVFFRGHLCKMMGIKNSLENLYSKFMEKYKVEKPEYEEDDDALFDAIFGGDVDGYDEN